MSEAGRYDEEPDVCTGCGRMLGSEGKSWCRDCAPELYGP